MKRFSAFSILAIFAGVALFSSCTPEIKVKANKDNSMDISFKTGFSEATSKSIKKLVGANESDPLFSPADMVQLITEAGAVNVSAKMPTENDVQANGTLKDVKNTAFNATGILRQEAKNGKTVTTLSIGPDEIKSFYSLLDANTQAYVDTMMIPCLIGEDMSKTDYKLLLSMMYGPTFAEELVEGNLNITLESADGKKQRFTEKLGDLLTMNTPKTWTIE